MSGNSEKTEQDNDISISLSKVNICNNSSRRSSVIQAIPDLQPAQAKTSKWALVAQKLNHTKRSKEVKKRRSSNVDLANSLDGRRGRNDLVDKLVESLKKSAGDETDHSEQEIANSSGQSDDTDCLCLSRLSSYRNVFRLSEVIGRELKIDPLQRFRRIAHLVRLLVRVKLLYQRFCCKGSSLTVAVEEMIEDKIDNAKVETIFDPLDFKALKEVPLTKDAIYLLSLNPSSRTSEQIQTAMKAVKASVPAFNEYPLKMQRQLISVCWYERFEEGRMIIRQGHQAECFYFILSGIVLINKTFYIRQDGKERTKRVARLGKGASFGELALLHHKCRNATVVCKDDVSLLAVGQKDFCDIFMSEGERKEPEHISYLKSVSYLKDLPLNELSKQRDACLFHYFRRGLVMVNNSESDWIYIAKTGSFRVLTKIMKRRLDSKRPNTHIPLPLTNDFPLISMSEAERMRTISREYRSRPNAGLPPLTATSEVKARDQKLPNQATIKADSKHGGKGRYIVVQVEVLKPKDQFGLSSLLFNSKSVQCHLVSNGGECILISKEWLLRHASETTLRKMRAQIPPYPSQEELQQRLVDQANWNFYKSQTLNDILQT
ncbi:cyclic nucleotide-binding domain-containing protein 2-like [Dendronephthya gigantea]|uniref:cyclic nucleotide-binding domain-containing protein 2-like n=1 Tax=Dendronephthya gigantea TaxID=151771 RepID=UPI00106B58DA|nr:cyclic nucleotide-binding domain-containing protein 2-like [Dendronephthya gigantea]